MEILYMYIKCFIVGGGICALAQLFINLTKLTAGRILVYFMITGIILQAFGLYEKFINFAGAGASVPISGFGYLLAEGAIKGARNFGLFGAITGGLASASAGITAAVVFSFIFSLIFKPKSKMN
jgi:stage V sporulation protein AE